MLKHLVSALLITGVVLSPLAGCKGNQEQQQQQQRQQQGNTNVSVASLVTEGLDLTRLPELARQVKTGEELERLVNESNGINNLDLNQDGKVDFLNVEEFRENSERGFVLFTNEGGQRNDIARVAITQSGNTGNVSVQGNPQYYGNTNNVVHQSFPWGQILLAAWLFDMARPRFFHPPYFYGSYPRYYRSTAVVPRSAYRNRIQSYAPSTSGMSRTTTSGSSNRMTGNTNNRSLSNVQGKSFSTTTNKRPPLSGTTGTSTSSGGFGTSSSRNTTGSTSGNSSWGNNSSRSSSGSSTSSRSTSGTTSGGSSWGGSSNRSSSGSSWGGSSNRSSSGSSFGSSRSSSSRSSFGGGSRRRR